MFDESTFLKQAIEAAVQGMVVLRQFFTGHLFPEAFTKEFDGTLVTDADTKSEAWIFQVLRRDFPGVSILREEGGLSQGNADWIIWVDPLDGTSAFALRMPTSTVIIAAYSLTEKQLLATVVVEPAYGRIWFAGRNTTCQLVIPFDGTKVPRQVWQGNLSLKSTVFIDISHSFRRKAVSGPKELLQAGDLQRLFSSLIPQTKIMLPGSNGLNHALVANGGQFMAGAITTAMGGPWDVAGALLVTQAGGICRAFNLEPDRSLREADPLDPLDYDFLICGNNQQTADTLTDALNNSLKA